MSEIWWSRGGSNFRPSHCEREGSLHRTVPWGSHSFHKFIFFNNLQTPVLLKRLVFSSTWLTIGLLNSLSKLGARGRVPQIKITKRNVDGLRVVEKDTFFWDTDLRGFGLKLTPAGRKSYVIQYRVMGGDRQSVR